jgi:peptide/nickel transport system permease protein
VRIGRYLVRRVIQLLPVLLVIATIQFALIQLAPGDAAQVIAGENQDPGYIAALRERFGLDQPLPVQYVTYLGNLARGDLGDSYTYGRPVINVIWERMPPTLLLLGTSMVVAALLGTALGTLLSRRVGGWLDVSASIVAIGSYSIPVFWLGLVLILIFGVWLRLLPTSGFMSVTGTHGPLGVVGDVGAHLILPAATLASVYVGQYLRLARSSVRDALREDFVNAARAMGFSERTILFRYALRNALLPIVTVFGLHMGLVLAGAVLTETVFSWPGIGTLLYQAILARDVPLVTGAYFVVGVTVVVAALVTDLVYAMLDPRVEYR